MIIGHAPLVQLLKSILIHPSLFNCSYDPCTGSHAVHSIDLRELPMVGGVPQLSAPRGTNGEPPLLPDGTALSSFLALEIV